MACIEMHNSINGAARISFSNEFVEIGSEKNNDKSNSRSSLSISKPSVDFEFTVTDYSMIPADEIFLKGKILPLKDTTQVNRTLREELLAEEEGSLVDGNIFSLKPLLLSSSSFSTKSTWKELLGLKRAHVRSKTGQVNEEEICPSAQDSKIISGTDAMRECHVADT